jgi:low affinity Fe/Cu permease
MFIELGVAVVLVVGAMSIWKKDKASIEAKIEDEITKIKTDIENGILNGS